MKSSNNKMNKMMKKVIKLFLIAIIFINILLLTSCDFHMHTFVKWSRDLDNHWKECECGETIKEAHKYGVWVSDEKKHWKECECGAIYKESHTYDKGTTIKEATCTIEGIIEYKCTKCENGYYIKRESGKVPVCVKATK